MCKLFVLSPVSPLLNLLRETEVKKTMINSSVLTSAENSSFLRPKKALDSVFLAPEINKARARMDILESFII